MTKCLTFSTSSLSRGWLSRCSKVGAMHTARFFASILLVSECWLMWWNRHSRCCRRRLFALGNFSAILEGGNNRKKQLGQFSINHSSNFNLDEGGRAKTELFLTFLWLDFSFQFPYFQISKEYIKRPQKSPISITPSVPGTFFFTSPHICS